MARAARTQVRTMPQKRGGNKVAGYDHQVGIQPVDQRNRFGEWDDGKVVVVVQIAQLHDAKSVPGFGQPR